MKLPRDAGIDKGESRPGARRIPAKPSRGPQGEPRAGRTRERIVEAFIEACGERGAHAASVAGIARRAGIDRATFYRHFEGKADLMDRGIETFLAALFRDIEGSAPARADPAERILARLTRFFEILRERGGLFRILLSGAAGTALREKAESFVEEYLGERRLAPIGEEALALPLSLASRALASLLFGFASWWLDHPGAYDEREMASICLEASARAAFKARPTGGPARLR